MNFLPVVIRELRAASRRKGTYRARWVTATIAIVLSFFFLLIFSFSPSSKHGANLFVTLSYYAFALCIVAGIFVTSDALSEEKREGTLGLLFLTDLRGYDVVLGKFIARSLGAIFGLVAVFPVMALPLMLGGVTPEEFWRMTLALLNALFFSLAAGICVSACVRDSQRAMSNTVSLLVAFTILLPLLRLVPLVRTFLSQTWDISLLSPYAPFRHVFEANYALQPGVFKSSLAFTHVIAWGFILIASLVLPRTWMDKGFKSSRPKTKSLFSGRTRNREKRQKLLSRNPILWLMSEAGSLSILMWVLVLSAGGMIIGMHHLGIGQVSLFAYWISWPFLFLLKLALAIRATQFYAESRRSGALELLLSTPLTNREIVRGQWLALQQTFMWPVIFMLLFLLYPMIAAFIARATDFDAVAQSFASGMMSFWGGLKFIVEVLAIVWFGMWMGLSSKRPNLAVAWTMVIAVIVPTLLVACCWADVALCLVLIFWSKGRLEIDLRRYISGDPLRNSAGS